MKKYLLPILLGIPFFVVSQQTDTLNITEQVNYLLKQAANTARSGDFEKAKFISKEAEVIAVDKLGKESAEFGDVCYVNCLISYYHGNYDEAIKWINHSQSVREKIFPLNHPDRADCLTFKGMIYLKKGQYQDAESNYLKAKKIMLHALGKSSGRYVGIVINLANVYNQWSRYQEALPHYLEAIRIFEEEIKNTEHQYYLNCLTGLANLYRKIDRHEEAITLNHKLLKVREQLQLENTNEYAIALNNLAICYSELGHYDKGEPLLLESKVIRERLLGKSHPEYAHVLVSLAGLYLGLGFYDKAEEYYLEAKQLWEKTGSANNIDYANTLKGLVNLYSFLGRNEEAKKYSQQALEVFKQIKAEDTEYYAETLAYLALLYANENDFEKANELCTDALKTTEKFYGKKYSYALRLNDLAKVNYRSGNLKEATSNYITAKDIIEKEVGKENNHYITSLTRLLRIYQKISESDKVDPLFLEWSEIEKGHLTTGSKHLSENELSKNIRFFNELMNRQLSHSYESQTLVEADYNNILFYKGFILNTSNQLKYLVEKDSSSMSLYNSYRSGYRRLAKEYQKPFSEQVNLEALSTELETLEKELIRTVAGFGNLTQQVHWQEVHKTLKDDEAAIEFVHFNYHTPDPTDSVLYAALVLRPGWESPKWITLFEEKQLEALLSMPNKLELAAAVNHLYSSQLHDLVWKALESHLVGVKRVHFSPSGLLHRLNFAAIPDNDSTLLSDTYQLYQVNSTRNLVLRPKVADEVTSALVYGDINYEQDTDSDLMAYNEPVTTQIVQGHKTRGYSWDRLEKSKEELELIESQCKTNGLFTMTLSLDEATEESFKQIGQKYRSPTVLHLATHGFFFPDIKKTKEEKEAMMIGGQFNYRFADNPLLRSGLILAGGNKAWRDGKALPGKEDGILTAYEISNMNLTNTDLVVLSACKTGLGDIKGSEGVYGLQRAFKKAGVDYLIMSLWSIPDSDETVEFMDTFYRHWLSQKMSIRDAFNQTQREMRAKYPDPLYWAGFVLVE